jgi:Kef-type K+ transport system membrane component KefB
MGTAEGGGWYDENTEARISIKEKEVGALPFKYRFIGWSGDSESKDTNVTILMDGPKEVSAEWERVQYIEVKEPEPIYKAIISIGLLIVAAKILGGLFTKIDLPEVLGELFAGMILGPYALGGLEIFYGPIIELNEYVLGFAEIGAILLLFIAGLEISFSQFKAVGFQSVIVGTFGVVIPFFTGLFIMQLLGFPWEINLLVAAALTATSIAITLRTLESFGRLNSIEGNIMINSAIIDDVLGLVVLAVVISIVTSSSPPLLQDLTWILFRTVAFWLVLLVIVLTVAPKFVGVAERWETRGTVEAFSTATCFASAVAAIIVGLSPIVGAFAAGMALAGSKVIVRVRDYIEKLSILFSPIFFAVIGAQFNIRSLNINSVWVALILLFVAVVSKLIGCGLPAMAMLRDVKKGFRVGLGMVSRGEVGLIIVGIGMTSGILTQNIYGAVVTMVILTTILTPIALKWSYSRKERGPSNNSKD